MSPLEHWSDEVRRKGGSIMLSDPVAAIIRAVAEEREACAALVERLGRGCGFTGGGCCCDKCVAGEPENMVTSIRARGKADAQVQQCGPDELRITPPPVKGPVCPVCGAALRWTSDPPSEPGPYWWRRNRSDKPLVVHVHNRAMPNGPFWPGVFFDGVPEEDWLSAEQIVERCPECQWSGPLVHPPG